MTDLIDNSFILVVNDIDETLNELLIKYPKYSTRVIRNEEKDIFLLAQANEAIREAFIASNEKKYIFLCGASFKKEAQNSLLKILEEPPKNIRFIIITNSKSSLLKTIYSRLPYKYLKNKEQNYSFDLNLKNIDLKNIYLFLKNKERIEKEEAKLLIQTLLIQINYENIKISKSNLDFFSKAMLLLELNSKPINVITTVFLYLLKQEKTKIKNDNI